LNPWRIDLERTQKCFRHVEALLLQHAMHLVRIVRAPEEDDQHRATDYVVEVQGGRVAVRHRFGTSFRDWTIRAKRGDNTETELAKLRAGHAHRYLYLWHDATGARCEDWALIDLDLARASGLLAHDWPLTTNADKTTAFISIPIPAVRDRGALLASSRAESDPWQPRNDFEIGPR
jgi:hypothetical protein